MDPGTHIGHPEEALGSCLTAVTAAIWEVNQQTEDRYLSPPVPGNEIPVNDCKMLQKAFVVGLKKKNQFKKKNTLKFLKLKTNIKFKTCMFFYKLNREKNDFRWILQHREL